MTYAIGIVIQDGKAEIRNAAGDLPDGQIEVTGHDDGTNRNITVLRRDGEGRFVEWAHHNKHPEESG